MSRALQRMVLVAIGLGTALVLAGCSTLLPQLGDPPAGGQTGQPSESARDAACETVRTEWGYVLDPWRDVSDLKKFDGFATVKSEHQAMIADMQEVAAAVDEPEVRAALDTSIEIHERFVNDIWDAYAAVPEGHVIDLQDPNDPMNLVSGRLVGYESELLAADVTRYDLCGAVQDSQTAEQACVFAVGPWVDAGEAFYASVQPLEGSEVRQQDVDETMKRAEAALQELRNALVQVTAPEVLPELEKMYVAYEDVARDLLAKTRTTEELQEMTDDEADAYITEAEQADKAFTASLDAGTDKLKTVCGAFD